MIPLELGGSDGTPFYPFMIEFYFLLIRRLDYDSGEVIELDNSTTWFCYKCDGLK